MSHVDNENLWNALYLQHFVQTIVQELDFGSFINKRGWHNITESMNMVVPHVFNNSNVWN